MSLPESARAARRLLGFAGSTLYFGARVGLPGAARQEVTQAWARDLCRRCGIEVQVAGRLPAPGVLLVSNHRSYTDIAVYGSCTRTSFVAKEEIRSWPALGWAADRAGTVFVRRESRHSGARAMKEIEDRVHEGESVTVFPEGTTVAGPGIGPFQRGVFRLAAKRDLVLLPAAVEYERSTDAWTREETDRSFLPHFLATFSRRRVRVRVAFGEPLRGTDANRLHDETRAWILSNLAVPG